MVLLGLLFVCHPRSVEAAVVSGFETPTYTAGSSLFGTDGWNDPNYGSSRALTTPASGEVESPFVLGGEQSAYIQGGARKSFASAGIVAQEIGELSWLQASPGSSDDLFVGGYQGGFLWINIGSATPTGIAAVKQGDGSMAIRLFGLAGWSGGGQDYIMGSSGSDVSQVYRFYMQLDFDAHSMTGYYSLGNGNYVGGASGQKILLGTVAIPAELTAEILASDYGIGFLNAGGYTVVDDIMMTPIPEPGTVSLVGIAPFAAAFSLRGRRRWAARN